MWRLFIGSRATGCSAFELLSRLRLSSPSNHRVNAGFGGWWSGAPRPLSGRSRLHPRC